MCRFVEKFRCISFLLIIAFTLSLSACAKQEAVSANSFVGKWRSSRLVTPLYLHENGDWEIKSDEGTVLQYGVWQYKDDSIVWSFRTSGSEIGHDVNKVLSVKPKEFQLREKDQTVSVFVRLD